MAKITDAAKLLRKRLGDEQELRQMVAEEKLNVKVAHMIYDARTSAGLTQKELAGLIDTKQQVIARLEDADYDGHSLTMLQRIAEALNKRLEVSMLPADAPTQHV